MVRKQKARQWKFVEAKKQLRNWMHRLAQHRRRRMFQDAVIQERKDSESEHLCSVLSSHILVCLTAKKNNRQGNIEAKFKVGDKVQVKLMSTGKFEPAKIMKVTVEGSIQLYDVKFENGQQQMNVEIDMIGKKKRRK